MTPSASGSPSNGTSASPNRSDTVAPVDEEPARRIAVFAPTTQLTVTIESTAGVEELHDSMTAALAFGLPHGLDHVELSSSPRPRRR